MSRDQTFDEIKAACKREGKLYEDPDFTATDDSLFYSSNPRTFVWKRPKELSANPKFFLGRPSRFDVQLGFLDDSWLLSAIACAATYPVILGRVIPFDQYFDDRHYCGAFRFNFWFQGEWIEVIVDDRLPTDGDKLVFVHSENPDIFWSALFEKAYAKLHGSYEALKGGKTGDAIVDITGRLVETIDLKKISKPEELYLKIARNCQRSQLMGCSIKTEHEDLRRILDNGLVTNHAFSVTGAAEVPFQGKDLQLIRVRNPWGNKREWKGNFGDESPYWREISEAERRKISLTFEDDGEFWMTREDFIENFTTLEMLVETGTFETFYHESWKKGISAGGCRNFLDTFHTNPQTLLEVEEQQNVTIALLQKDSRKNKQRGKMNLTIGFAIYKIPEKNAESFSGKLNKDFFSNNLATDKSDFLNDREVSKTFYLERGKYVIVPSTFEPNQRGYFLLRVFKDGGDKTEEEPAASRYRERLRQPLERDELRKCDDVFNATFEAASGDDESVDAFGLQAILTKAFKDILPYKFPISCCLSIIKHYDTTNTASLEYREFKKAWTELQTIKKEVIGVDTDKSKSVDENELKEVLKKFHIRLSNSLLKLVLDYYANKDGVLQFDGVIDIILTIRRLSDNYQKFIEKRQTGVRRDLRSAQMTLDEFLSNAIAR